MVSSIVILKKDTQDRQTLIVKAEDWLNPDMYLIDAQDPYTNDTWPIEKDKYEIGWPLDENYEPNYNFS
ncbi:MAG: hypothetical protein ACOYWZ_16140 [Bacillota bacterium]